MKKVILACAVIVLLSLGLHGATSHSVDLNWLASATPTVTGYHIYRSTTSGGPYSQINTGSVACCLFTDTLVSSGATYYYVVRSFDGTEESANSNEARAVIPQAPQPPTGLTATVH
jgi:fibronectin type 3 domain-containing protein